MKKMLLGFAALVAAGCALAGVPIKFNVETSRADVQTIDVYHGETLEFEVSFKSYGKPMEFPADMDAAFYWQTNGMDTAFWRTNNVTVATNGVMSANFTPEMDIGSKTVLGFIGVAGEIYRASFILRFKNAPGYNPAIVEWPYRLLDFNTIEIRNPPFYGKSETYTQTEIKTILAEYDKYANSTNREETIISNLTAWAQGEFRTLADSYSQSQIDSFLALLQTQADTITATNTLDEAIRAWAEEQFQKSWELEEVELGKDASATGTRTTALGAYAEASGISSIALGNSAKAAGTYPIALGLEAKATNGNAVAIGAYADATEGGVHIGVGGNQFSHGYARKNAVALGNAKAEEMGLAFGEGAEAANQSIAIGRGAKATHTAAVAFGPLAESVGDATMRIKFSPSEIYLGFWTPKSLQEYFDEISPDVDFEGITNLVNNAPFVPTTIMGSGWSMSSNAIGKSSIWALKKSGTYSPMLRIADGAQLMISGGNLTQAATGTVNLRDPSQVFVGSNGKTNLTDFVKANSSITEKDPTVSAWAKAASKPSYNAAEVGAMSEEDGATLATQLATIGAHLNAEDAQFVVTNYDSKTHVPEASVRLKLTEGETSVWHTVWSEMTRWNDFFSGDWLDATNAVANKAEKEYAFYDGVTGDPAPDGFFWISQPRVAICAGASYQRYGDTDGSYWVLESNGMAADINGTTNGYFRITDSEGEVQFEIIKGDKRDLFATAATQTTKVMDVLHLYTTYAITNAVESPKCYFSRGLGDNQEWIEEGADNCPMNVTWTNNGDNTYTVEWWPIGTESTMFMKCGYTVGGETRIKQTAPVEMEYIYIGGKKYKIAPVTVSGTTVLGLTEM